MGGDEEKGAASRGDRTEEEAQVTRDNESEMLR